jgi:hypothetical protein
MGEDRLGKSGAAAEIEDVEPGEIGDANTLAHISNQD